MGLRPDVFFFHFQMYDAFVSAYQHSNSILMIFFQKLLLLQDCTKPCFLCGKGVNLYQLEEINKIEDNENYILKKKLLASLIKPSETNSKVEFCVFYLFGMLRK